jgi:type II secretory pathway pseudopilin PulG
MTSGIRQRGLSLIELAVLLVILGLVLVLAVAVMPVLTERDRLTATDLSLEEISSGVVAFAATHGRLPCPDTDADGLEDCAATSGTVPWRDIGFADANLDRAHISIRYATYRNAAAGADLTSIGNGFIPYLPGDPPTVDTDGAAPANPDEVRNPAGYPPTLGSPVPASWKLLSEGVSHRATGANYNQKIPATINDLDFCLALRNARAAPPSAGFVHTLDGGDVVNAAFVLASGGVEDADGSGVDVAFDGANQGSAIAFESPARRRGPGYDDLVLAMPFDLLESRMSCAAITIGVNASANIALAAAHMVAQAEDLLWQAERAVAMDGIAVRQAGFSLALAILGTITSAADAVIAGTSCSCPALADNCVAIPLTIAATVVAAGIIVVASFALDQALQQQDLNDQIYLGAIDDLNNMLAFAAEACQDALDVEERGGQGDQP